MRYMPSQLYPVYSTMAVVLTGYWQIRFQLCGANHSAGSSGREVTKVSGQKYSEQLWLPPRDFNAKIFGATTPFFSADICNHASPAAYRGSPHHTLLYHNGFVTVGRFLQSRLEPLQSHIFSLAQTVPLFCSVRHVSPIPLVALLASLFSLANISQLLHRARSCSEYLHSWHSSHLQP